MINEKKIFTNLNADDSIRLIGQSEYLNMENMRIGANEFARNGALQNIPSTQLLDTIDLPEGDNLTIGRVSEIGTNRLFRFNYNSEGEHGIYCQDLNANVTYIVLLSSQTVSGFNWSKSFRIDKNARVVNGLLEYTDNNNEPKEVNIEAGIKLNQPSYVTNVQPYATPVPYETATLIKRPPIYRLQAEKLTDIGFKNNYIKNNAYQFTYRYQYKNYQYSCLSTYSQLMPYNAADDTFNFINVTMNFSEIIPDYVIQIDFCVRYGNTGKTFIIKSYNKNNPYDLIAIESHNAASVQLGFSFYDNLIGIALDDVTANTSFHGVALLAKTIEAAKNRAFLANLLKGYNTPSQTSLTTSLSTFNTGGGTYTGEWKTMSLWAYNISNPSFKFETSLYYVYVSSPQQAYYFSVYRGGGTPPTVNAADADAQWNTEIELAYYIIRNNIDATAGTHWSYSPAPTFNDAFSPVDVIVAPTSNLQFFKSSSTYQMSIAFFDRFRRKCGVVTPFSAQTVDDRTADQTEFATTINWTLNNNNALVEIPDWAYFYQIHISRNQTTAFFVQIFANGSNYAVKEQDGTYTYSGTYALNSTYAIAIDLTALTNKGLGYTFNEGDLARLYFSDDTDQIYSVLGVDGNYVLLSPADIGALSSSTGFFIELYTPYKPSTSEPMYETGDVMPIINPATSIRQYSTLVGSINGDTYAIERDNGSVLYFVEAMSPNDNVWQFWQTDRGWVNFIDTIGQQRKETAIDYSDTFINGTKVNGLNNFEPLNTKDVGNSSGSIQKLQLTNKQEEDGTVMIVITEGDCLSAYLSEVQLVAAARNDGSPIQSIEIIGTINALKNGYGTLNPESVVEYNGVVWWWDVVHGVVAQYAQDGVTVVSDNKLRRFTDRWSKRYLILGKEAVEALCGFSYIDSCVDASTDEVFFMLPQVEVNAVVSGIPVGFAPALPSYSSLPSYATSIQNRFDIYDGQPKIISYKYLENKWQTCYLWLPDCMDYLGSRLVGYKNGKAWLHNEDNTSFNVVYGVQYPQRICFTANSNPSLIRDIFQQDIEGNFIAPTFTVIYSESPDVQISDLIDTDYVNDESVLYATVFRDRISPNATGTADEKLYKGDVVKSAYPLIMMEFTEYASELIINFVDTQFDISRGHSGILPKPKN